MTRSTKHMREIAAGVASALAVVAAAIVVAHLTGTRIGSAQAAGSNGPGPTTIAPNSTATGFSAIGKGGLPAASAGVIGELQSMHPGNYANARQVAAGLVLAENNGAVCMWKDGGLGGCTDRLNASDAWLAGDMIRMYDSETAPFEVHLYGIARDNVSSFTFNLADGKSVDAPVTNNGFSVTIPDTAFADIVSLSETYGNGATVSLDPSDYFPAAK